MSETNQPPATPPKRGVTRHLDLGNLPAALPRIDTRPLDYIMPWVIEFRVVGTPSVIQVRVRETLVIGRSDPDQSAKPDIDLEAHNAYMMGVSRRHAQILTQNNWISVQDLGSANGTFLNGGRLEEGAQYRLNHGDRLKLGQLELQVLFVVMPTLEELDEGVEQEESSGEVPVIGAGQRVLVIEDDDHVAQTIQDVLTEVGFKVTLVNNVTDALFMLADELPDIMVLELMMPDRSGLDAVQYVRSREDGKSLPVVVVSSASGGYRVNQAVDAGIDLFLKKPFGIDELVSGFKQIVSQMSK